LGVVESEKNVSFDEAKKMVSEELGKPEEMWMCILFVEVLGVRDLI